MTLRPTFQPPGAIDFQASILSLTGDEWTNSLPKLGEFDSTRTPKQRRGVAALFNRLLPLADFTWISLHEGLVATLKSTLVWSFSVHGSPNYFGLPGF
jgi:hypothetical protein